MLKNLGGCWSSFTRSVVKVAHFSMGSIEYMHKAHVGVKGTVWHSRDLIKSASMVWSACPGDLHNAVTFPPSPDTIFTASYYHFLCHHHCLLLLQNFRTLSVSWGLVGFSSQVHGKPLPGNCSYAGDRGKKVSPERLGSLFRVFEILPYLDNAHLSEGTRDFYLLG